MNKRYTIFWRCKNCHLPLGYIPKKFICPVCKTFNNKIVKTNPLKHKEVFRPREKF